MWRSLVARTLGVGEAPSSNLGIPITEACYLKWQAFRFFIERRRNRSPANHQCLNGQPALRRR